MARPTPMQAEKVRNGLHPAAAIASVDDVYEILVYAVQ
jgi:hypothetical protein